MIMSSEYNEARRAGGRAFLDNGLGYARLQILGGVQPGPGGPATTVLTEIVLDKPCGAVATNQLTLKATEMALVLVSGEPTWARMISADGRWAFDCSASGPNGNGEVKVSSDMLYAGGKTTLVLGVLG